MGKYRLGTASYTIKASTGAEVNPYNFYSTSYSTQFGKEGFDPRKTRHLGTGYISNLRPAIYYSESLDNYDNVAMLRHLRDNYVTTNQRHLKPYHDSDGKDKLPFRTLKSESGFTRPAPQGTADYKTVYATRAAQIDKDENPKPHLHKIQLKKVPPIDRGSMSLLTFNDVSYEKKQLEWLPDKQKDIGKKEPTGFTNCHELDPIEHLPKEPYIEGSFNYKRPTEFTVNQQTYNPYPIASGKDKDKGLTLRAQRSDGFTTNQKAKLRYDHCSDDKMLTELDQVHPLEAQWTKKNDPAEYVNFKEGSDWKSLCHSAYLGKPPHYVPERGDNIGKIIEPSGFSLNHLPYNESKSLDDNFTTHYQVKHLCIPRRDMFINRGETEKLPDGFTKGTSVHGFGDKKSFREKQLEKHIPLVARRIKKEEPYFTHSFKDYKWNSTENCR